MVVCDDMDGETGDVEVVSMSQPLLRDPRILQLNRLKPAVALPAPGRSRASPRSAGKR
jgi:hypothetical protein